MKKISIKDVAKKAGVSPTTVSRVINNSDHPVSESTKKLVESAIAELDFEPNRLAQGLINNKSNIIGVIVHDISDPYFAEILKGIEEIISDYDYIINIYNTFRDIDKELKAVNTLRALRADGIVFAGGSLLNKRYEDKMHWYVDQLRNNGTVVVGVASHPFSIKTIPVGNNQAAKMITEYLCKHGHQRIAYINGPEIISTTRERLEGFKDVMLSKNIFNKNLIIDGDFSFEGGRKAGLKLLEVIDSVSAVVAANDESALGLIWELKNRGVKVPEDISVVGIGNIPESKYSYPPLTTISLPIRKIGLQVGSYLISMLEDKPQLDDNYITELSLVERDSVRI